MKTSEKFLRSSEGATFKRRFTFPSWEKQPRLLLRDGVAPIAGHHEVCDRNRPDAAFPGNKDSPFGTPPGPNPHRLSPAVGVALDPPDGSGTKSLRSSFSHIEMESKSPLGATSQGV